MPLALETGRRLSKRPSQTPRAETRKPGSGCRGTWWGATRSPCSNWPMNWQGSKWTWGWVMKAAAILRELKTLRQTQRDEGALLPTLPAADESLPLAGELAASFGALVEDFR